MATEQDERYHRVDTVGYECCKLFGKTGVPEYTCGVLSFPDFLELQITTTDEERAYYQACLKVTLHRQVGSRYFVSAVNATKILFLMKFTEKDISGNKLERDVFDMTPLSWLTLIVIMCTEISKSTNLDLSVYQLELQTYLSEVESCPEIVFVRIITFFPLKTDLWS